MAYNYPQGPNLGSNINDTSSDEQWESKKAELNDLEFLEADNNNKKLNFL